MEGCEGEQSKKPQFSFREAVYLTLRTTNKEHSHKTTCNCSITINEGVTKAKSGLLVELALAMRDSKNASLNFFRLSVANLNTTQILFKLNTLSWIF